MYVVISCPFKRKRRISVPVTMGSKNAVGGRCTPTSFLSGFIATKRRVRSVHARACAEWFLRTVPLVAGASWLAFGEENKALRSLSERAADASCREMDVNKRDGAYSPPHRSRSHE